MNISRFRPLLLLALPATLLLATAGNARATPDFGGTWVLYTAEQFDSPVLTPAGAAFRQSYDFRKDDPALQCIAASWTRIYSNPNTPFEIEQLDDRIRIRYELFDMVREVPLTSRSGPFEHKPNNPQLPNLGDSVAWYDGDMLFIHSQNYGDEIRVLSTIRGWAGIPQSPLMVTLESYWIEDGELMLEITHFDPLMYDEPLSVTYAFTLEPDYEVEFYGCEPEDAAITELD